jgi:hypothetical protein
MKKAKNMNKEPSFLQDVSEVSDIISELNKKNNIHEKPKMEYEVDRQSMHLKVIKENSGKRSSADKNSFNIRSYKENLDKVDMILKESGKNSFNTNFTSVINNSPMNNF